MRRLRRLRHLLAHALVLAFVSTGCDGFKAPRECETNDDCPSAHVCTETNPGTSCVPTSAGRIPKVDATFIPAGTLTLGCPPELQSGCQPQPHLVTFADGFVVERTEVSVASFASFLSDHGNTCDGRDCVDLTTSEQLEEVGATFTPRPGVSSRPVTAVSWYGAREYCAWSDSELCSEAQWEAAARGVCVSVTSCEPARRFPWGASQPSCELAVMDGDADECSGGSVSHVGSRPAGAGPFGTLDLAGNASEWVLDTWQDEYENTPNDGSAWRSSGHERVVRGGDAASTTSDELVAFRRIRAPATEFDARRGFRCCRE